MIAHLRNAAWGMADYLAYPLGLLLVAPVALRALGMERYGVWTVATAAVSTGAIVASGFGDAATRAIATHEALNDRAKTVEIVQTALALHTALGMAVMLLGWYGAPWLAGRTAGPHVDLVGDCTRSLRIASVMMPIRAVETVCVSTQRAFGRYRHAVDLSLYARMLSLSAACLLPLMKPPVSVVMGATAMLTGIAVWLQFCRVGHLLGNVRLQPAVHPSAVKSLMSFGVFTWLLSLAMLFLGQVDRLIAGAVFGAAAVTAYTFCAQLCQPVYGLSAAGQHFLFPHLASRQAIHDAAGLRRAVAATFAVNLVFVAVCLSALLVFGSGLLRLWGGDMIAIRGARLLPLLAFGTATAALSVTGVYSMLALNKPHTVTLLNLAGCAAMLASMPWLVHRFGLEGMAMARLIYAPFVLAIYVPLLLALRAPSARRAPVVSGTRCEEEA